MAPGPTTMPHAHIRNKESLCTACLTSSFFFNYGDSSIMGCECCWVQIKLHPAASCTSHCLPTRLLPSDHVLQAHSNTFRSDATCVVCPGRYSSLFARMYIFLQMWHGKKVGVRVWPAVVDTILPYSCSVSCWLILLSGKKLPRSLGLTAIQWCFCSGGTPLWRLTPLALYSPLQVHHHFLCTKPANVLEEQA